MTKYVVIGYENGRIAIHKFDAKNMTEAREKADDIIYSHEPVLVTIKSDFDIALRKYISRNI